MLLKEKDEKIEDFNDHELIFLGTGGGRFHCVTQYRHTGGFIYAFNGTQAHLDPGPGAIVYLNQMKVDKLKTKWVIVSHAHTDHNNDVPVILESMHTRLDIKEGTLISTQEYINELDSYYKGLLKKIIPMKNKKSIKLTNCTEIMGTKTIHGSTEGFGLIFNQISPSDSEKIYKLAYTGDTQVFKGYSEQFQGVDVLIANVLRPDNKKTRRHTSVDEIIEELKKIRPKVFIMTHFGSYMDSEKTGINQVPRQVEKVRNNVGFDLKVIGAEDGMRLKIKDLLKQS